MRSKQYLKNSKETVLLFSLISINLLLSGCQNQIEPTYKEESIPAIVKQICKDEYQIGVFTKRTPTTLWIYMPLSKIFHKEYGLKEDKIFDDEMTDKLRNILGTIGRVLISSDNTPEFFALLSSDINLGIDYTIIGNVLDIKKYYAGFIPWTEMNRRYVMKLKISPEAIKDEQGAHLEAYDIKLPDFLAAQIAQRTAAQFQNEEMKKYFRVERSDGKFNNNTFIFEYSIKQITQPEKSLYPDASTYIIKKALDTITYCLKTYDFQDFSMLEINDLLTRDRLILNKAQILARPIE